MKRTARALQVPLFMTFIGALLLWGWFNRASGLVVPRSGIGYWFGIAGATIMLVVLLYPLRKRLRWLRRAGPVSWWFRWHMALGVFGPALIVLHSGYSIHSANAFVAFVAMLVVVASGGIGRYLYSRIHRGLYGAHMEARDLARDAEQLLGDLAREIPQEQRLVANLAALEQRAVQQSRGFIGAIANAIRFSAAARSVRRDLDIDFDRAIAAAAVAHKWDAATAHRHRRRCQALAASYVGSLRRAGNLAIYERLFALWHVLHLPLIVLLAATAVIHIVAVNLY